jgi:hypothetical protein
MIREFGSFQYQPPISVQSFRKFIGIRPYDESASANPGTIEMDSLTAALDFGGPGGVWGLSKFRRTDLHPALYHGEKFP